MPGNAPDNVTDRMIDEAGGACKQPTAEQVHACVCQKWRSLLRDAEDMAFEGAEVVGCYDVSLEQTDVLLTIHIPVPWEEVEK